MLDDSGIQQLLARPTSEAVRPSELCGDTAEIVEISNIENDHSGIFKGQCEMSGRKTAQITLWYFPNGQHILTIEDCVATGCKRGWHMPI